jgi:hypothetical protein
LYKDPDDRVDDAVGEVRIGVCQVPAIGRRRTGREKHHQISVRILSQQPHLSHHPHSPNRCFSGRAARHAALLNCVEPAAALVRHPPADSDAIAVPAGSDQSHLRPGTVLDDLPLIDVIVTNDQSVCLEILCRLPNSSHQSDSCIPCLPVNNPS